MKMLLSLLLLLTFTEVRASESLQIPSSMVCTGRSWIITVLFPIPMSRDMTVTVDWHSATEGTLTSDIGGEPLQYTGKISLDGQKMVSVDVNNGDIITMVAKFNGRDMNFTTTFMDSTRHFQGKVWANNLECVQNL